ncbi:hypothetical protein C8J57DRAFT_1595369 [Mycena rebaudengoi]|nr:hypothetical protein C8J57DRAFT_1595369 [Mycena rebaudengoi]
MVPPKARILLVGASGYVGGTVLHHILSSPDPKLAKSTISRITCFPSVSLDDTDFVADLASQHDIVINAGTGFHAANAEAMVRGLAKRQTATGHTPWMIHTSGCSNISDQPLTGESHPERKWDNVEAEKVYEFEKAEDQRNPYPQRTAELSVLDVGLELGVNTLSLQSPLIYGPSEGLFPPSINMIQMMKYIVDNGYSFSLGDGTGCIDIAQGCLHAAFRHGALPRLRVNT